MFLKFCLITQSTKRYLWEGYVFTIICLCRRMVCVGGKVCTNTQGAIHSPPPHGHTVLCRALGSHPISMHSCFEQDKQLM